MLQIAVCDDDSRMVSIYERAVREGLKQCGCTGTIKLYEDGRNLLCDITDDGFYFDLLLLDIEMPGVTGMELAERIRPFLPDVKIIFVTSHIEYAIDAFELSVFRYVPKTELEARLPGAVEAALRLLALEDGRTYTIQTNSRIEKIPYRRILYIEREGKNARLVTADGEAKVRKSLQQVLEELGAEEFIFTDRGCIVNLIHILQVKDGTVVLKDSTVLPVSRSHVQEVKEEINRYWGEHI